MTQPENGAGYSPRDREIEQARAAQDTKILQKVNAAHREAFHAKFPGQVEHCLRLTAERLQSVLAKTDATDLGRPETWRASPQEIADLSLALMHLQTVHLRLQSGTM
jgi:hypothetical protein